MRRHLAIPAAVVAAAVVLGVGTPGAAPARDHAAVSLNILAPGQAGLSGGRNATDQLRLYDALTARLDRVTTRDLRRFFKPARFGAAGQGPTRVERTGRAGVRIVRDRWGVPHITGRRRSDVVWGAGWVTAHDRDLLLQLIRGPARIAALDVPGLDAFSLALSGRSFTPSAQTEEFLATQVNLLRAAGPKGERILADVDAYVAGINAYYRRAGVPVQPWTRNDVIAAAALIGGVFGSGGGDERRSSEFLSALRQRLGPERGRAVWEDLRELDDPTAPVSVPGNFPYLQASDPAPGGVLVDPGSWTPAGVAAALKAPAPRLASNAILVGTRRSANRHPLFVAGPQVGYYFPEFLLELDLHGGGIDARGAAFPGISFYVLIGRGKDFAWSATSSGSDIVDLFAERLCGGDDRHYLHRGECLPMRVFDAGVLRGPAGEEPVRFLTTVHGPVTGYATVGGERMAFSLRRSTRGREILSARAFADLNSNAVTSARSFIQSMSQMEMSFNWFYADDRDIAMVSGGRLPIRAPGTDPGLPTLGTGEFEWQGVLPPGAHPQAINPPGGLIVNWNNKPARGFGAADDNWSYGSVQRVELLTEALARRGRRTHTLASVVAAMNRAATQDLRAARVLPAVTAVLRTLGGPPSERAARTLELLEQWRAAGASRLDRDLDGKIDHPGAAIMDAAWPRIADAVLRPVLGPLVERLASMRRRDSPPNPGGSAYGGGWYGYVEKDLQTLLSLRQPISQQFRTRFCGAGVLADCRASLWAALEAAGDELAAAQGPDPAAWRADARAERIRFAPGFLAETMRWTNRPTFQQVMSFRSHRRR